MPFGTHLRAAILRETPLYADACRVPDRMNDKVFPCLYEYLDDFIDELSASAQRDAYRWGRFFNRYGSIHPYPSTALYRSRSFEKDWRMQAPRPGAVNLTRIPVGRHAQLSLALPLVLLATGHPSIAARVVKKIWNWVPTSHLKNVTRTPRCQTGSNSKLHQPTLRKYDKITWSNNDCID